MYIKNKHIIFVSQTKNKTKHMKTILFTLLLLISFTSCKDNSAEVTKVCYELTEVKENIKTCNEYIENTNKRIEYYKSVTAIDVTDALNESYEYKTFLEEELKRLEEKQSELKSRFEKL